MKGDESTTFSTLSAAFSVFFSTFSVFFSALAAVFLTAALTWGSVSAGIGMPRGKMRSG